MSRIVVSGSGPASSRHLMCSKASSMTVPPHILAEFSPTAVHRIVKDLMRLRMSVYWADFLVSLAIGVLAFAAVPLSGWALFPSILAMLVLVVALYRAVVFLHEIAHFRSRRQFATFRLWWNLLCGIPMFMPVFMYECHPEHHSQQWYGTSRDAEYLPLASTAPREIIKLILSIPLLPLFGPLRFGLLTPASWFLPQLQKYVYENMSALKLDVDYKGRPPANATERRQWMLQESGCFLVVWVAITGLLVGWIPWIFAVQWYVMYVGIAGLDTFRLLGAHRYRGNEESVSVVDQMLDTYNYPRHRAVTELWAPVGLRLHALHHLLPGLPYHSYQQAHLRLSAELPADSPYRSTESRGLFASIHALWQSSRSAGRG
jgi:fatty acid desaturase